MPFIFVIRHLQTGKVTHSAINATQERLGLLKKELIGADAFDEQYKADIFLIKHWYLSGCVVERIFSDSFEAIDGKLMPIKTFIIFVTPFYVYLIKGYNKAKDFADYWKAEMKQLQISHEHIEYEQIITI